MLFTVLTDRGHAKTYETDTDSNRGIGHLETAARFVADDRLYGDAIDFEDGGGLGAEIRRFETNTDAPLTVFRLGESSDVLGRRSAAGLVDAVLYAIETAAMSEYGDPYWRADPDNAGNIELIDSIKSAVLESLVVR